MTSPLIRKPQQKRLSSPDQLDHTMHVTGPLYWTSLLAILVALVAAAIWSWFGNIPTKAIGDGTVIRPGGVSNVFSGGQGFIKSYKVKVGDHVHANQPIAEIYQPNSADEIRAAEEHLAAIRNQASQAVSLRQDTSKLQIKSLDMERANDQHEIEAQKKLAKITEDELHVDEQLYAKGLITHQVVVEAQQRLTQIQSAIARLEGAITQADSAAFQSNWQPSEMKRQQAIEITDLEARLEGMRNKAKTVSTVVAPMDGEIIEEKSYAGAMVPIGSPVASIQADSTQVIAVIYVPSHLAKEIKPGMAAEISPSTAKREEYGFIRGKVTFVAHYPATTAGMMMLFENDSLVDALRSKGPATEVDIALERAADTPSGFRWSSSRGPETEVGPGTLCQAQIITRQQKPITLVFPFLKKLLGLL